MTATYENQVLTEYVRIPMRDGLDRLFEWMLRQDKNEQTTTN